LSSRQIRSAFPPGNRLLAKSAPNKIDADHGDCAVESLRHGVLLDFRAPAQLDSLAGSEHGRTIPLRDMRGSGFPHRNLTIVLFRQLQFPILISGAHSTQVGGNLPRARF
jgi:hypothetical protein